MKISLSKLNFIILLFNLKKSDSIQNLAINSRENDSFENSELLFDMMNEELEPKFQNKSSKLNQSTSAKNNHLQTFEESEDQNDMNDDSDSDFNGNQNYDKILDELFDTSSDNPLNVFSNKSLSTDLKLKYLYEKVLSFMNNVQSFSSFESKLLQRIFEFLYESDLTEQCLAALITTGTALKDNKFWSIKCWLLTFLLMILLVY